MDPIEGFKTWLACDGEAVELCRGVQTRGGYHGAAIGCNCGDIRTSAQDGMETLDQALVNLYLKGVISGEVLTRFCQDRGEVEKLIGRMPRMTSAAVAPAPGSPEKSASRAAAK